MADRFRDKLTREDFDAPRATPPRRGGFRRALRLVLVLVLVLAVVIVAAYWDLSSADSLRRLLTYSKTAQDSVEDTVAYSYDSARGTLFALLGEETLLVVSDTHTAVYGAQGEAVYSSAAALDAPAVAVGKQLAAVYEVGGTELMVFGAKGLLREMDVADNAIVSVTLSASDYMAVVTEKSGYKSALNVYNASGEPVFTYNSSQYIVDAICERDGKHVLFSTVGERDGYFASTLHRYALDGEAQLSACVLEDALVMDLGSVGGVKAALAEDRLALLAEDGTLAGAYVYDDPYLRSYSFGGDGFAALALSRYRSGSTGSIVTVGVDGKKIASLETQRDVLDIDACGKYLAVLYSDKMVIYTADLAEYAVLDDALHAKAVLMRTDGTALLLGTAQARLFIP